MSGISGVFASAEPRIVSNVPAAPPRPDAGLDEPARQLSYPSPGTSACYNVLRFYEDGLVLVASICVDSGTLADHWPRVALWLHRGADNPGVSRVTYQLSGDRVGFTVQIPVHLDAPTTTDYTGTLAGDRLTLDVHNHASGWRGTLHLLRLPVEA